MMDNIKNFSGFKINENDDDMEHITSVLRQMIRAQKLEQFNLSYQENYDFMIEFVLKDKEPFTKMVKILDLMKKINKDILVNYECAIDLWKTKKNKPLLTVDFYYKSSPSKSKYFDFSDDFPY
jgi:hypothetical protein